MDRIKLNDQQPEFVFTGSEERMNVEILKVILKEPLPGKPLLLQILDENNFLLYEKFLIPKKSDPIAVRFTSDPEIPINKRFIFHAFLKLCVLAPDDLPYSVEVEFS